MENEKVELVCTECERELVYEVDDSFKRACKGSLVFRVEPCDCRVEEALEQELEVLEDELNTAHQQNEILEDRIRDLKELNKNKA